MIEPEVVCDDDTYITYVYDNPITTLTRVRRLIRTQSVPASEREPDDLWYTPGPINNQHDCYNCGTKKYELDYQYSTEDQQNNGDVVISDYFKCSYCNSCTPFYACKKKQLGKKGLTKRNFILVDMERID